MRLWHRLTGRPRFSRRYEIINYVADTRGFQRYLEIGTSNGRCLERVRCAHKVGVDPSPRSEPTDWTLHAMPSDAFFENLNETFDLIFIDGLHLAEQVIRDIFHSISALAPKGIILLHDCDPKSEARASREPIELGGDETWNGDVWKAIAYLRACHPELYCEVLRRDQGIGVLFPIADATGESLASIETKAQAFMEPLEWRDLEARRDELLGSIRDVSDFENALRRYGR